MQTDEAEKRSDHCNPPMLVSRFPHAFMCSILTVVGASANDCVRDHKNADLPPSRAKKLAIFAKLALNDETQKTSSQHR